MPAVQTLGVKAGMIDAPGTRKIHSRIAVRAGGIGVALAIIIALASIAFVFFDAPQEWRPLMAIGALAAPVAIVGIIEDATAINPKVRLAFQLVGVVSFVVLMFEMIETYAASVGAPAMVA